MEASCSGRCLDADHITFFGHKPLRGRANAAPFCFRAPRKAASTPEARALLPTPADTASRRLQQQSTGKKPRRDVLCAATPAVEVISLGEVADVEEIEGLRVVMNEYKRPVVEYLVRWKV